MADKIITDLYDGKVQIAFYPESHRYYVKVGKANAVQKTGVTTYGGIKDKSTPLMKWQQQITVDFLLNAIAEGRKIDHDLAIEAAVQNEIQKTAAADLGTQIHAWAEHYIKNKTGVKGYDMPDMPEDPRVQNGVIAFLDWEKEHKVKFITSERPLYSLKYDYVGTMDIEAMIGKDRIHVDLKSSNGLYNGVRMQTAAYVKADEEENGKKYKGRYAIRLSKFTEEEYMAKEERKKEIKRFICKSRGWEFKDYQIPPYKVFEAKFLDADKSFLERDFKAFLNCLELTKWDKATDPYLVGENW